MRLGVVGNLIARAGSQREPSAVREFRLQLAFQAEQNVPFRAPVIGPIARGVFHHANTNLTELLRSPQCMSGIPLMLRGSEISPGCRAKWNV